MAHRIMVVPRLGWRIEQHGEHAEDHERGAQHDAELVHPVGVAGHEGGAEDDERELGRLRRLELQEAEADPALGAVHGHADAGDEHGDEQPQRAEHEHRHQAGPAVVVDACAHDSSATELMNEPHALADEHGEGRAGLLDRPHRRRRQDHHRPEQAEQRDHDDEGQAEALRRAWHRRRRRRPRRCSSSCRAGAAATRRRLGRRARRRPIAVMWSPRERGPAAAKSSPRAA